jgi:3-oxoadipate enol-lactonase
VICPLPDGGSLSCAISGLPSGPPLLLLRPLGGTMALWRRFRAHLEPHFRVLAFDARGTGASSAPPAFTTTRGMAADARALLDHLAVRQAHVFGLSLGGMVGTHLAASAPDRVTRLVLASTVPRGLDVSAHGARRGLSMARCLLGSSRRAEACLVRRVLSSRFRAAHPEEAERIAAAAAATPTTLRGLIHLAAAAAAHDARRQLPQIRSPTLVLAGADDGLLSHDAQRELAARIPGACFEVIPDAGHDLSLEAPEATAARVIAFLTR